MNRQRKRKEAQDGHSFTRRSERRAVGVATLAVIAPCLLPALYQAAIRQWAMACFYAIPCFCCGLLYLGLVWMFGFHGFLEMGLFVSIIAVNCSLWTSVIMKIHHKHHPTVVALGVVHPFSIKREVAG